MRKGGGVSAVRADSTIELMSPVTLAAEAALWTATPNGTARLWGMYREIIWLAAEENWAEMELLGGCQSGGVLLKAVRLLTPGLPDALAS